MLVRPALQPHIRSVVQPGAGVFLIFEKGHRLLHGKLTEALVPLLDGSRTADEIVDLLKDEAPAAQIYYALLMLERKGYITEARDGIQYPNAGYWSLYDIDAYHVASKLAAARVSIKALGSHVSVEALKNRLAAVGIQTSGDGELTVVLVDDYLDPALEAFNSAALANSRRWILAKPSGYMPWIGPLFNPFETGCWECLAQRQRSHRDLEKRLSQDGSLVLVPPCDTPLTRDLAYTLLASEVLKWIASAPHCSLVGRVLSIDTRTWHTETHILVRRPQCSECGFPKYRRNIDAQPIELVNQRTLFTADGGYRCVAPEETVKRYAHHVSGVTGVIRELQRHPLATSTIHAYVASTNFAAWGDTTRTIRAYSGGKGVTAMQAKASALCEALERYSGVYQGYEPAVVATLKHLGSEAIHPNSCMLFSESQYQHRAKWNARGSRCNTVPEPFDETREIRWSPVWSLSRREFRYLPTAYCYYSYEDPPGASEGGSFCQSCSNGSAAGNTLEEAILQGFLELVERDCVSIWWYNSLRRPQVDLSTLSHPYVGDVQERYREAGRRIWVLDITSDLDIPAYAAVSSKADGLGPILLGFGCHLDSRLAVLRALTEMNQLFLTAVNLEDESSSSFVEVDPETAEWLRAATLSNQPHLVPDPEAFLRTVRDHGEWQSSDIRADVVACQDIIEQHGLEMLVLDQTRPDVDLAVAKVIVPGLRHFWARFAPGRLYEVPTKMNWLATPRREEDLNPVPIFF
jgi:oxazoline/thiazoline synthase